LLGIGNRRRQKKKPADTLHTSGARRMDILHHAEAKNYQFALVKIKSFKGEAKLLLTMLQAVNR